VYPLQGLQKVESGAETARQFHCIVSLNRQPAAPFRSLWSEGSHKDMPSGSHGHPEARQIGILIGRIGKEMKYSSIVPEVDLSGKMQVARVSNYPLDLA